MNLMTSRKSKQTIYTLARRIFKNPKLFPSDIRRFENRHWRRYIMESIKTSMKAEAEFLENLVNEVSNIWKDRTYSYNLQMLKSRILRENTQSKKSSIRLLPVGKSWEFEAESVYLLHDTWTRWWFTASNTVMKSIAEMF